MSNEWAGWPVAAEGVAWESTQAMLEQAELSDGLPMVPPTLRRLSSMLAGAGERAYAEAAMPPLFGELTREAVAYQCVLAGCVPAEMPVVMAAAEACLDPDFNLLGIATTTGTACVALCVHGALAAELGVNASTNCLGPGVRANAAIGRALQLTIRNVGGAKPEVGDMATMGQPGKYTFCFAEYGEDPTGGAFPPLPVRRGFAPDARTISVLGVSGTAEVLPTDGEGDTAEAVLQGVAEEMRAALVSSGVARKSARCDQVFLLPPEMALKIARHDWDLARVQRWLFERCGGAARSPESIHPIVAGGAGVKMTYLPLWGGGTTTVTRIV